jgi:hypothetical protein
VRSSTLFEDAIDVPLWLERDRAGPYAERVRRDRELSTAIVARDPIARVHAWWREVARDEDRVRGARFAHVRALITFALIVAGAFFGATISAAVLHYDGTVPVNVVRVLGVLIVPQWLLLIATLLFATGLAPGLGRLHVGTIAAAIARRFASDSADLLSWHGSRTATARFARWQVIVWSQFAAVAFNVAAIAVAVGLITFTDLAFGWSTTLAVDSKEAAAITRALAWPWHAWLHAAVPSNALIETSRFYRMEDTTLVRSPEAMTGWWRFVVCALVVYGALPRIALLVIALFRQRGATRRLLLDDARVSALLDRMSTPALALEGEGAEPEIDRPANVTFRASRAATQNADAIVWSGSVDVSATPDLVKRALGVEVERVVEAGGDRSLAQDRATADNVAVGRTTVVAVRAFEPPLLELLDFLRMLRARIGPSASIVVLPLAAAGQSSTPVQVDTWRTAIARLDDPATYVEAGR